MASVENRQQDATESGRPLRLERVPDPLAGEAGFRPVRLLEVELSASLPAFSATDPETGVLFESGLVLVRLHSQPLGVARVEFDEEGLSAAELACQIWSALGKRILLHLRRDDLPQVRRLGAEGLPGLADPPCLRERKEALAHAPFVTVVVPTRDRPAMVRTCLGALTALEYPEYELLIVDNAPSSDATAKVVAEVATAHPFVRYLREDRPGASYARNRGLREARGEVVAFTDDDATVDRYWLAELVKAFGSEVNVGCVTGNVLPQRLDTPAQAWFEERGGFGRGYKRRVYDLRQHRGDHPLYPYAAMVFGSGNNMAFRASVLRAMGGFDPALDPSSPSRGGEDLSAFFETIVRGYRLVYEPAAFVRHLHRRDFEGLRRQMFGWGAGFAAFLARSLLAHPRLIPDFALRMPYGVMVFVNGRMPYGKDHEEKLTRVYSPERTRELWREENSGYLHGLPAYVRSRWNVLRLRRRLGGVAVA